MEIVAFSVGGSLYGLDAKHVNRVIEHFKIFSAPFMPDSHIGLLFYRGELFDVIDAGILFNQKTSVLDSHFRIILMKWDKNKLAIIPDVVVGLVWIDDQALHQGVSTADGQMIELITPDSIWDRLLKLSYGPGKI
ncbi:MAG TPA: chemotaxis protein CheW [Desulfatirhabdiaceae bacterium]|nr:chemotaxis protein CheW [Desulfatirhabdiaceae bacterium]